MFRFKTFLSLTKKEILSHIDTPATSIALIVFIVIWQFIFFRNVFLIGETSLRTLYDYLPWLLLLFSSAVTMGVFSQEKNEGTLELLLTHPVTELEVVISKFFGSWFLVFVPLIFSIPIAISFSQFGTLDWGAFVGQFLSGIFLSGSLVALGLYLSSLLTSPIASMLATAGVSFFLILCGSDFVTANLPLVIIPVMERLSLLSHVTSLTRGVIDSRDIWYFVSFMVIFLSLAYLMLLKRKFGNRKDYYIRYQLGIFLFIGIAVVSNVLGSRIPGRVDLTKNQSYSISNSTKNIIGNLSDIVTITFYASSRLPSQLTPVVRDIRDLLRDYQQYSKGNISVIQKDPSNHPEISSEATSQGVREVQFNVIGQEEFQLKTGFVGMVISYGDKHEAIPLIQQTGDLEYQLTGLIAKLTTKSKKKIVFLSGHGEKNLASDYQTLNQELQKQFITETVTLDSTSSQIASDAAELVIAGPTQAIDQTTRTAINNFLQSGKSVFFMVDMYTFNPQTLTATLNQNNFSDFIANYGVSVSANAVYDLRSSETIRVGQNDVSVLVPYPFWIRGLPAKTDSPITQRLTYVTFPWAASLATDTTVLGKHGLTAQTLIATSPYASSQKDTINISPNAATFSKEGLSSQQIVISASGPQQSTSNNTGKFIVIGDSDFMIDQFVQNNPQNLAFGLGVISYLAQQNSFADVRIKQDVSSKLVFRSSVEPSVIKYGNMLVAIVLPAGVVLFRWFKRRNLRNRKY